MPPPSRSSCIFLVFPPLHFLYQVIFNHAAELIPANFNELGFGKINHVVLAVAPTELEEGQDETFGGSGVLDGFKEVVNGTLGHQLLSWKSQRFSAGENIAALLCCMKLVTWREKH